MSCVCQGPSMCHHVFVSGMSMCLCLHSGTPHLESEASPCGCHFLFPGCLHCQTELTQGPSAGQWQLWVQGCPSPRSCLCLLGCPLNPAQGGYVCRGVCVCTGMWTSLPPPSQNRPERTPGWTPADLLTQLCLTGASSKYGRVGCTPGLAIWTEEGEAEGSPKEPAWGPPQPYLRSAFMLHYEVSGSQSLLPRNPKGFTKGRLEPDPLED